MNSRSSVVPRLRGIRVSMCIEKSRVLGDGGRGVDTFSTGCDQLL
jgi:hypothetical protein